MSSVYAHGGQLELVVPRSRHNNFNPLILAIIKDQDNESKRIAYELYRAGLTTLQVGDLFDKIYGKHYSKSAISSMMSHAKEDVGAWLNRNLEIRYPIIYIDATYWHIRRDNSVSKEAYYTVLGVKQDRTREVLAVVNWIERLNRNYKRTLRMRTSMPSPESVLFLLGSIAIKRTEYNPITQFINLASRPSKSHF